MFSFFSLVILRQLGRLLMIVGLKGEAKEVYFRFLSSYPGEVNVTKEKLFFLVAIFFHQIKAFHNFRCFEQSRSIFHQSQKKNL